MPRPRRRTRALLVGALAGVALPQVAMAQATGPVTFDHSNIVRAGSPRQSEIFGGGAIPITQPIGLRDCPCETWTFHVYTSTFTWLNPTIEFWVGTDSQACFNNTTRAPGSVSPTCWQIPQISGFVQSLSPAANNANYVVTIPSVLLVNPFNRACVPLNGGNSAASVYLSVLARGSTTDNMGTPGDSIQINYIVSPPDQPTGVGAAPQDSAAHVTWTAAGAVSSVGSESSEAGTVTTSTPSLTGYYVLCFPTSPPTYDAGSVVGCEGGTIDVGAGAALDATDTVVTDTGVDTGVDAFDESDITDIVESGVTDTGTDAAITDTAVTDAPASEAGLSCGTLPAGFDPNNDTQFNRYVCSSLQTVSTASFDVQGLTNGQNYWFAVVAEDTAGNRSVSSATPCVTPQPVTDFWQHYRQDGGAAQPGFCAIRPGRVGWGGFVSIAFGALVVRAFVRRKRGRRP